MRFAKSAIQRAMGGDPYWNDVEWLLPLDGTNGATATTDVSINALANTLVSCSLTTSGPKWGSAALSTGIGSKLSAALPAAGTGQFILEGWFYWTATGTTQVLWETNTYTTANGYEVYTLSDGSINVYAAAGGFQLLSAPAVITAGAWHHIALKRNASNAVSLWVNGISVASGTWAGSVGANIVLGNIAAGSLGFVGKIDDFRATHGTDRGVSVVVPPSAFPTSL